MSKRSDPNAPGFLALVPAAGVASRLPQLRTSKEMSSVPMHPGLGSADSKAEPVICHLLRSLRLANIIETRIVLRTGKWDIPDHLSNADWDDMNLRYTITSGTSGVPETILLGLADKPAANVLFGFPDILFEPVTAFETMSIRLLESAADVVLGAFPTRNPAKMDMIGIEADSSVSRIDIKNADSPFDLTWILAAWRQSFTAYVVDIQRDEPARVADKAAHSPVHLGHVLQLAIEDGMRVEAQAFPGGRSIDIGTPDDLECAAGWLDRDGVH